MGVPECYRFVDGAGDEHSWYLTVPKIEMMRLCWRGEKERNLAILNSRVVCDIADSPIFMRHEAPHGVQAELAHVPALNSPILARGS